MLLVKYCDPEYSRWPDGTVKGYMQTPCVGWTDGTTVARRPEQLPGGPVPPHKSLIIYSDGAHVEALVLDRGQRESEVKP
jgi:hypothetical protein